MIEITRIEKTKKGRFSLMSEDEFLFSIHPDTYASCEIKAGCRISEDRLSEIQKQDEERSARDRALVLLSHSDNTAKRLYDKLRRYYSDDACVLAVRRMEELGLVNDKDYAGRCARDLVNLRGWSLKRVAMELRRRGIDEEIIAECIDSFEEFDADEKLLQLIEKKYYKYLSDEKGIRKVINALMRLGYSYSDIRRVLKQYNENIPEED